jgi:hypothetical protein
MPHYIPDGLQAGFKTLGFPGPVEVGPQPFPHPLDFLAFRHAFRAIPDGYPILQPEVLHD